MELDYYERPQWLLSVLITHGPKFGHRIRLTTTRQGCEEIEHMTWLWTGLGVPAEVVKSAQAFTAAVLAEHLTFRYGVAEELPLRWAGDPEPF